MTERNPELVVGRIAVYGPVDERRRAILSDEALAFVEALAERFEARRRELLAERERRHAAYDRGDLPDFPAETASQREAEWTVAPLPEDLLDRRVEITGPVDRKMVINALNSGANVFMADFEDANSPTWANCIDGQVNLYDAVRRTIEYVAPNTGKHYELAERTAVLFVRPRGLHLPEAHVHFDGEPISASLFDFGLYFFHNARAALERGTGPYFYLPKLEHYLEARWWNDVFAFSQDALGIEQGRIKATVLIETLPAAFQMDEILWELREHSAGLNCGRWDYIFSYIKTFRNHPDHVLPDRGQVTMQQPMMRAYTQLAIRTCHRRGVHAMGGMAAQIPIKGDPAANEAALAKVRADKLREVRDGHDGTWVAHPALVPVAREIFDAHMPGPNQIERKREDVVVRREDLFEVPEGTRTDEALRHNIRVGVQYIEAWLRGTGCVPLYYLMEDAATAEICRTQLWQWLRWEVDTADGRRVDAARLETALGEELERIRGEVGEERFDAGRFGRAARIFRELVARRECADFLTLPAYEVLVEELGL